MFPTDEDFSYIEQLQQLAQTQSNNVSNSLVFDFEEKRFVVTDGTPLTNADIDAIKQWIILFLKTQRDTVEIYKGTKFGTSIKKIIGYKTLNNGFVESEIEREIREGFPLNPGIKRVISFNMSKENKVLLLKVSVELYNGSTLEVQINV